MEYLSLYPFDKTLYMPPFLPNFEAPKFESRREKVTPDHIHEFFTTCIEVVDNYTYLIHLFPCRLGGQVMKWFSHLLPKIRSRGEPVEQFVAHFSHNIENPITLIDICAIKKKR